LLDSATLNAIAADFDTCEKRHCQSLEEWLKTGSATMAKLINALKNVIVHENQLAQKLESKYSKEGIMMKGKSHIAHTVIIQLNNFFPPLQLHSVPGQWKC